MAAPILATICAERIAKMVSRYSQAKPWLIHNNAAQSRLLTCLRKSSTDTGCTELPPCRKPAATVPPMQHNQRLIPKRQEPVSVEPHGCLDAGSQVQRTWLDLFKRPKSMKLKDEYNPKTYCNALLDVFVGKTGCKVAAAEAPKRVTRGFNANSGSGCAQRGRRLQKVKPTPQRLKHKMMLPKSNTLLLNEFLAVGGGDSAGAAKPMYNQSAQQPAAAAAEASLVEAARLAFVAGKPYLAKESERIETCLSYAANENAVARMKLFRACF